MNPDIPPVPTVPAIDSSLPESSSWLKRLKRSSFMTPKWIIPTLFVIIFAVSGLIYLVASHAATSSNTYQPMAPNTSPSVFGNVVAFQCASSALCYYNVSNGQTTNTGLGMMAGTSPSLYNGHIAFQANTGQLYTYNILSGATVNTFLGMDPHSSPSIFGDNNQIAFEANTDQLFISNGQPYQSTNTYQGMAPGTSPSDYNGQIAFNANTNQLFISNAQPYQSTNTYQGMDPNSSPSMSLYGSGSAFNANTCDLFTSTNQAYQSTDTGEGMDCGTSPSMYGGDIAFDSNTCDLYVGQVSNWSDTGEGMACGTNPSIYGNIVAFQANTGQLYVYNTTATPPPPPKPTASLSGPGTGTLIAGDSPTLTYYSTNATSCSINGSSLGSTSGSITEPAIDNDTSYTLTCTGAGGSVSATTTVEASAGVPDRLANINVNTSQASIASVPGTKTGYLATDNNWSGYIDPATPGTFTLAQGTVVIPKAQCAKNPRTDLSVWVGIDGDLTEGSHTVEQDGFQIDCNAGTPVYYAWTEMWPKHEDKSSVPIAPGDKLYMRVWYNSKNRQYALQLINYSLPGDSRASKTVYDSCNAGTKCLNVTAEWIVERPTYSYVNSPHVCYQYPFTDFGQITFTNAMVSDRSNYSLVPFADLTNYPIDIYQSLNKNVWGISTLWLTALSNPAAIKSRTLTYNSSGSLVPIGGNTFTSNFQAYGLTTELNC